MPGSLPPAPRKPLRLWPGVTAVALQWLGMFVLPAVAPEQGGIAVIDGLAAKGLTVSRPDLAPFRANADKVYAGADAAKAWDRKLMKEAMAVR